MYIKRYVTANAEANITNNSLTVFKLSRLHIGMPVSRFECVSGLSVYPVEIRSVNNLGERSRGRPRLNFMKSLSQLLKISEVEIIERTRNREEWKTMTANVRIGYGT